MQSQLHPMQTSTKIFISPSFPRPSSQTPTFPSLSPHLLLLLLFLCFLLSSLRLAVACVSRVKCSNMAIENGVSGVTIKSKTRVLPTKATEKKECPIVTFDLPYLTFFYNQKVLLYKGNSGDFEEMVGRLKDGLGVVLNYFYPLAGRLGLDEEGVLRVEKCGDEDGWVEVAEAVAHGVSVADLAGNEASALIQEIVPFTGILNVEGLHRPLLAVQVTKLRDGLAVGCAFNHVIVDGSATWHFMSSWAEICRGAHTISLHPFHDRTQSRNTRVKLDIPPSFLAGEGCGDAAKATTALGRLRERIFHFSGDSIDKIKAQANAGLGAGESKPFSTFQALGAHIWQSVTRARQLKGEEYTVFTVFADCRKRVEPAMPAEYFGNLIQAIFTVTTVGEVVEQGAEYRARLLQEAIGKHDAKAIEARSKEWEEEPKLFEYKDAGINCVAVGSSPRFEVYEVDFGWGRPEVVRSGMNNKFDGMVFLYPGRYGGGSIDVEISLEPHAMEELEKDKEFLSSVN